MTEEPIASVTGLHVSFETRGGTLRALRGVDLSISSGEVVALVGESGSGKSVLASCLLGLPSQRATLEGTVLVSGIDMLRGPDERRRMARRHVLGAVFQDPLGALNPTMRVGRLLQERGLTGNRAKKVLTDVAMPDVDRRLRQWPHELSGGLRQRVAIGFALGADGRLSESEFDKGRADGGAPLLLIADEPTTALDVSVQAQVLALFDRLRTEHSCALLLVTHDLAVAASIADRIVVLYAGRVCEDGPVADVLKTPAHPYTASLLAARLELDDSAGPPVPMIGSPPNPLSLPTGCAFRPRCPRADDACAQAPPEPIPMGPRRLVACLHTQKPDATPRANAPIPVSTLRPSRSPTRDAGGAVLTIDNVTKSFAAGRSGDQVNAVRGVSLLLGAGDSVALVGESGCGKTTLLRVACGLTNPDSGSVTWSDGRRPQLVFQDAGASLTPWFSIERQVIERLRARGISATNAKTEASELFELVGLDEGVGAARPAQISGGQRQRAAIARALASAPSVLICDEPISALDASLSVRILDLLHAIRRERGVALLFVTHDLAAARYIADEVAVMYLGRIVEQAPSDLLFRQPLHPYTNGLLAASPTSEPGRLAPTLDGEPPSPIGIIGGCSFAGRCHAVHDRCHAEDPMLLARSGRGLACHLFSPDRETP